MGIILDNVSYTYQEGTPFASVALSDVSLTIEDGSYTAIIGHTGSGKSTILQLLNGFIDRLFQFLAIFFHGDRVGIILLFFKIEVCDC